ncbi:hypothetical protein [Pelagibaculum spongiae]|uniref:Uncharacterized protein n=1 Tax=Pelagibaculum spongiae TaxID=2080658 RepID=A0A2V1GX43_9GAMM|nr:hypothetical protein [Pelagibaculum spongiae]PVZ71664.1 hypothetical protein DC094_01150 [Pelagibaculum spongiae]
MKRIISVPLLFSAVLLAACGGGGGSSGSDGINDGAKEPPLQVPLLSLEKSIYQLDTEQAFSLPITNRGGITNSCTANPNLPQGLRVLPSQQSCVVTGAALSALPSTTYQITATNSAGQSDLALTLAISDIQPLQAPAFIAQTSASLQNNANRSIELTMGNIGGSIDRCTITPALPGGLSLISTPSACAVAGTSNIEKPTTTYTVTASNAVGEVRHRMTMNIEGGDALATPMLVQPSVNQFTSTTQSNFGVQLRNSGGPTTDCQISPDLPEGLVLYQSHGSCGVSGSTANELSTTAFVVSGINNSGRSQVSIALTVNRPPLQVPALSLATSTHQMDTEQAFSLPFINSGGAVDRCTANPSLPAGLTLVPSRQSCLLAGATLSPSPETTYLITAANSSGRSTLGLTLTISDSRPLLVPVFAAQAPTSLRGNINQSAQLSLINNGGAINQCDITPNLPRGLLLLSSPATCVIAGATNIAIPRTIYTVTASNAAGAASRNLAITIRGNAPLATPALVQPPANQFITSTQSNFALQIQNNGGPINDCQIAPDLPEGLVLYQSQGSCSIGGASTDISPETTYTITGLNRSGQDSASFSLTVNAPDLQKPLLTQTNLTSTLTVGDSFFLDLINQGGIATQCIMAQQSSALPAGLSLSVVAGSCVVHGSATADRALTDYVVLARNDAGDSDITLRLTVLPKPPEAPAFVALGNNFFSWQQGRDVILSLENSGGDVTECAITPALPAGLSFTRQGRSCALLGTADQALESTVFEAIGSNRTSSTQQNLIIEILEGTVYTGEGPDPEGYDHVVVLSENRRINDVPVRLHTDINDPESIFQLSSAGFPNRIASVKTESDELLTDADEIDRLFRLFINPATGIVEIYAQKPFDFEKGGGFYSIELQLGDDVVSLLLRIYNVQNGSEAEPLTISSFNEFHSFMKGRFVSENIGFDLISLTRASEQNRAGMFIQLGDDIDASETKQAGRHWPGYFFEGQIDGRRHVIDGLRLADGKSFLYQINRFNWMRLYNLGLTDVRTDNTIINNRGANNITDGVFVEGVMALAERKRITSAPLTLTGDMRRIYANMYIDIGQARRTQRIRASGLFASGSAPAVLYSGYSNGRIVSQDNAPMIGGINGFTDNGNVQSIDSTQFISAIQFDISNPARSISGGLQIGGFSNGTRGLVPALDGSSNDKWRFIKDRNNSVIVRHVGNSLRDIDNDGLADPDAPNDLNWENGGRLEADAKSSSQYTGVWSTGDFDLTEGHIPVLKNMPYPHINGADWMDAPDPGVAYQHNMYDYYLTDPRTR